MSSTIIPVESVKTVSFSGKRQDWDTWKDHFYARAAIYRYDGILRGLHKVPSLAEIEQISESTVDPVEKRKLQLYQQNSAAYGALVTSISMSDVGKVAF